MVCLMSGAFVGVSSSSYRDLLAYQVSWLWRGDVEGVDGKSFLLCALNGFTPAKK